jgi:hypothetical protein
LPSGVNFQLPSRLENGPSTSFMLHLAPRHVGVARGEGLVDAAEGEMPISAFMPSGPARARGLVAPGQELGYLATSVTSANISSALYQMRTDLWTVFMENAGPARGL